MGVKLEQIVGGDPYAFYSGEMGQGDHARWGITGLEAKPDGSVYVMGNANNYGPVTIRQYDARGNYRRMVFPYPAGKPVAAVKGWGVNIRGDETYTPQYNNLEFPSISTTPLAGSRNAIAGLFPSPDKESLLIECPKAGWNTPRFHTMRIGVDGTIAANQDEVLLGPLVKDPMIDRAGLIGSAFMCLAPDGKSFYLSGLYASPGKNAGAQPTGFWRDGQVWKVDVATRTARPFFALDEAKVIADPAARAVSPIADTPTTSYAAFHGVAVAADGHVLVCDRQNQRVAVLDPEGRLVREIPVLHPDALALNPMTKALYVTTRVGNYHKQGTLQLLKFNDWTKDSVPAVTLPLGPAGMYVQRSFLAACQDIPSAGSGQGADVLVWVAYTQLPVRVYRDTAGGLELVKDFYEAGPQRELDVQHFAVDPQTEKLYLADGFGACFRIDDWKAPRFALCLVDEKTRLSAVGLAIDARNRHLYTYTREKYGSRVARYTMDGKVHQAAPLGGSGRNEFTPGICHDWNLGLGYGVRGLAVAPDGSLATLGVLADKSTDVSGPLNFFPADPAQAPWQALCFEKFGKPRSAGVRFDVRGNLYVGKYESKDAVGKPPAGFEKDANFLASMGRIYKYAPTRLRAETKLRPGVAGSPAAGNLFPSEPAAPAKVYEIHYGSISPGFPRCPRFGVDGYGRIYYPTSLEPRVSAIDNEGNAILSFGTYGNRDSMGGLAGDLVPTKDIPMAWPNSVDATDDFIYVSDIVNIRLLRLAKTFAAVESMTLK
jgi:hypothetical protein